MDGEKHSANAVLVWAAGLSATTAAVLLATKWWWRGERKSGGTGGTSARKPLARSSGVRVVCVQDSSSGSDGLLSGWGTPAGGGARDGKGGQASKWEQSKQKGDLGYYFAHHTSMKELAPEDYRMNGPRLLSKGDTAAADASDDKNRGGSASPPPVAPRRRAQQISSYSWEDYGEEVRLTFRQSSWNWAEVEEEEIEVQWGPRRLRLSIDSREYGLHTIDLPRLSGEVADVGVLKMKKKLVVALVKGGRGSYSKKAPWDKLQTDPAKPSD